MDGIEYGGTVKALVDIMKEWYADSEAEGNEPVFHYRAFSECVGPSGIRFAKNGITRADFGAKDIQTAVSLRHKTGRVMNAINIRSVFD